MAQQLRVLASFEEKQSLAHDLLEQGIWCPLSLATNPHPPTHTHTQVHASTLYIIKIK
jgi:hypothetical protein